MNALNEISAIAPVSLYRFPRPSEVACYLASTPQTRAICSDPLVYGVEYTDALREASTAVLRALDAPSRQPGYREEATVVLNILRGGLNYNLRDALKMAYGWNTHRTAFISSQRARDNNGDWYITENRYQKISLPDNAHIVFGDVVATGVSLEHALIRIIEMAQKQKKSISGFTFFTIGGMRAIEILEKIDAECRRQFPGYVGSSVIYYEGIFGVADENSKLSIVLPGTDLLHSPAILAPEFIRYQTQALSYPIERCVIYDAGSRSFDVPDYLEDVRGYWRQVRDLAEGGMTYVEYLAQRFEHDDRLQDSAFVRQHSSAELLFRVVAQQLAKISLSM